MPDIPEPQVSEQQPTTTPEPEPVQTPAPEAPPASANFVSSLRERGIDLGSDVQDDAGAYAAIQRAMQERQQLQSHLQQVQPYAQAYVENYDQFQQYMKQQKPAAPAPAAEEPYYSKYWSPPPYDPNWLNLVERDEQGRLVAKAGAPPNIPQKLLEYSTWRQQREREFFENPHKAIEPTVQHLARQIAQEEINRHLGAYRDQQFAQQFTSQNAGWLFAKDQNGQPVYQQQYNPQTGFMEQKQQLSDWGQVLLQNVVQESQRQAARGYQDIAEQQQRAMERVQLQYAMTALQSLLQKQQPGQQAGQPPANQSVREAANDRFEKAAQGRMPRRPTANNSEPPQPQKSLRQTLMEELKANGIESLYSQP